MECDDLVRDGLVDEMCDESGSGVTDDLTKVRCLVCNKKQTTHFIVSFKSPSELTDESSEN